MGCSSGKMNINKEIKKNPKVTQTLKSKTEKETVNIAKKVIQKTNKENYPKEIKDERNLDFKFENEELSKEGKKMNWLFTHQK